MNDLIGRIPSRVERRVPRSLGPDYWIPRWAWLRWMMRRLGLLKKTQFIEVTDSITSFTIRATDIIDFLFRVRESLLDTYGWEVSDLYVGREHFAQLLRIRDEELIRGQWGAAMSFEIPDAWATQEGRFETVQFHGIIIHFVPWFKGVLAIPAHQRPGCVDFRMERHRC